ncbi:hypothetical protein GOODEAATRI_029743 [Goodea atripinnis]|uniref:Uncharacterized protein n=1 Tax=Goodea atripinnis TaxID=208336 RepID=A0ABV0MZD1_9TELE
MCSQVSLVHGSENTCRGESEVEYLDIFTRNEEEEEEGSKFWGLLWRSIQRRILHKMKNPKHPLHQTVLQQQSVFNQRLHQICCKTERYRRSFLPTASASTTAL